MTDNNTYIDWIQSRRSIGKLNAPAPTHAEAKTAIACAMTAPDHKKIKPWRFFITEGDKRQALTDAIQASAEAKAKRDGQVLDNQAIQKIQKMAFRAPMVITVVTRMQYHEKVPAFEQVLSTGACVQNLILALQAMGYQTIWRTGPLCNEAPLKQYFNVSNEDYIAGYVYVGKSDVIMPERQALNIDEYLTVL